MSKCWYFAFTIPNFYGRIYWKKSRLLVTPCFHETSHPYWHFCTGACFYLQTVKHSLHVRADANSKLTHASTTCRMDERAASSQIRSSQKLNHIQWIADRNSKHMANAVFIIWSFALIFMFSYFLKQCLKIRPNCIFFPTVQASSDESEQECLSSRATCEPFSRWCAGDLWPPRLCWAQL